VEIRKKSGVNRAFRLID